MRGSGTAWDLKPKIVFAAPRLSRDPAPTGTRILKSSRSAVGHPSSPSVMSSGNSLGRIQRGARGGGGMTVFESKDVFCAVHTPGACTTKSMHPPPFL